jgi:hypothetical protein
MLLKKGRFIVPFFIIADNKIKLFKFNSKNISYHDIIYTRKILREYYGT